MFILTLSGVSLLVVVFLYHQNATEYVWWELLIQATIPIIVFTSLFFLGDNFDSMDEEFWSDGLVSLHYQEMVERYEYNSCCTRYECNCTTDKEGNRSCDSCCDSCYECNQYGPHYWANGASGAKYRIGASKYTRWKEHLSTTTDNLGSWKEGKYNHSRSCGKEGNHYRTMWDKTFERCINLVTSHSYQNKVIKDGTLFTPAKLSEIDLEQHPKLSYPDVNEYEQDNIVGFWGDSRDRKQANQWLQYYNAMNGAKRQVRVFIFLVGSERQAWVQKQLLGNGNKNEYILILSHENGKVTGWQHATWTPSSEIASSVEKWLQKQYGVISLFSLSKVITDNTNKYWVRREFTPLNDMIPYIPPWWLWLLGLILCGGSNFLFFTLFTKNFHKQ